MKNRGCIIGAIILASSIMIGCVIFYIMYYPRMQEYASSRLAEHLENITEIYYEENEGAYLEDVPNWRVIQVLTGDNFLKKGYFPPDLHGALNEHYEVIDGWRHPYHFQNMPDGTMKVVSPGKNGAFGDADDITSETHLSIVPLPPAPEEEIIEE